MHIIHIAAELAPICKVGGLADVVQGLSRELVIRGNLVEIILPKYKHMRYELITKLVKSCDSLLVEWHQRQISCTIYKGFVDELTCFFIEADSEDNFFNREDCYGEADDAERFAFFSKASMEFLHKSNRQPDIIHCHDWHTGLIPVFQTEVYQYLGLRDSRTCYTIHNFKHQGICGEEILCATDLNRPEYYFSPDRLGDNTYKSALNLMKGGIVYSDFVTTVSPTYALEAKKPEQGFGLEKTLQIHHEKFEGVINGIDMKEWNPQDDRFITENYSVQSIERKLENKRALRECLQLEDNKRPIIAYIGRLDAQKGLELVRHSIFYCINNKAQFVLLGTSPDPSVNEDFEELKDQINQDPNCHLEIRFDEELAHQIYAGADMLLVPSRFEPCGLTQLIAMRYGTIPVVRSVGGLADTVFDKDNSEKDLDMRNGYVFKNDDIFGVESALERAITCFNTAPKDFHSLIVAAMQTDHSWSKSGQRYIDIYTRIGLK